MLGIFVVNRSFILCLSCCGILAISAVFAVLVIYDLERESAYWENQNSMSLEVIEQYKNLEAEHKSTVNELERESAYWENQNSMSLEVIEQYKNLEAEHKSTVNELERESAFWENQNSMSLEVIEQYKNLEAEHKSTVNELERESAFWENQNSMSLEVIEQYKNLEAEHKSTVNELEYEYGTLESEFDEFYSSIYGDGTKFLTIIEDGTVLWDFVDSKGNEYYWEIPMQTYEEWVLDGASVSLNNNRNLLSLNGKTFNMIQYEQFVVGGFTDVVDEIYHNSESNDDFVWEVWWIVSQMAVYREDVDERSEGRFALETFTRQGGDCEDLAILIADMLASSRYTHDWTIQLVLMDLDNPTDPREVNHMIVYANDGNYDYFIEATGDPSWDWYPNGIDGWWYDVDV